jgi:L-amino acid N-acyltransferase YncA
MIARPAVPEDAPRIAEIYNQGIAGRRSTFQTKPRTAADIVKWFDGRHPIVVVEENGVIAGWASTSEYRSREHYSGVAEFSVYVANEYHRRGVGRLAMEALIEAARAGGFWKLLSRVFPENGASLGLLAGLGFREVGTYHRHARLDGVWRDVVIVELLIDGAAG